MDGERAEQNVSGVVGTVPLLHFSRKPLTKVYAVAQEPDPEHKPNGLWVSWGDGEGSWPAWCENEGFGLKRLVAITEIELVPTANILRLSGADDIDAFDSQFSRLREYQKQPSWRWGPDCIGWNEVAAIYDGILIAPYIWERRLHDRARWYYTWDCASGCIWNPSAVARLIDRGIYKLRQAEAA